MSHEYRNQKDMANNARINELLNEMPDFVEDFHTHLVARSRSSNTILGYMYEINVFLKFVCTIVKKESIKDLEVTDLDKITLTKAESYIAKSEDGIDLSPNAKRRKLSVLKSLYAYYFGIKYIKTNPVLNIEGPKLKEHDVITLSESQVKALLNCISEQNGVTDHSKAYSERLVDRDLAIVMTLLGTGMRISELVGLNLSDFDTTDPGTPCLHIVRKGGDDDIVYLIRKVYLSICDYLEFSRPQLKPLESENALFIGTTGKRISPSAVQKMLKKYCEAAGLPDNISPHKMRATFATTVYKNTKDIYAIKDALHHSSIDTSKHYISDKEERKQKAVKAAEGLFE